MGKPWEAYRVAPAASPTIKEEDLVAGTEQSRATTENTLESAETERVLREDKRRKLKAEADLAEAVAQRGPPKTDIEVKEESQQKRAQTVDALMGEVERLYKQDIEGQPIERAFGATEYIPLLPENERFTAAGNNILPLIRPLIAQTAKEGDSNTEMTIFQSYVPSANDSDITIEQKMKNLRLLLGGMIDGKPPSETLKDVSKQEADNAPPLGEDDPNAVVHDEAPPLSGGWDAGGTPPDGGSGGGGGPGGAPPSGPDRSGYSEDLSGLLRRYGTGLARGTGDLVEGAGDFAGIALNPIGNMWYKMLGYNQPYDAGTILRETVGLPDNPDPLSSMINKGGSAALTGSLAAKGLGALAAPGAMKNALSVLSAQPGRDIAIGGAASGAGELAREGGYGAPVQALATLAGGLGSSAAANRVVSSMVPKLPTALAQAAERQGVNMLPADAGGPVAGIVTSAARASPISVSPIVSAAQKAQGQMSAAASRAAQSQGSVPTTDTAGEWLQQAAKRYSAKTKDIGDTLYRRAFKAAGDVSVPAPNAVAKIDGMLKGLRANPETNAGAINDLIKLRRDLVRGQTAEQMHQLRSEIGQGVFDGNLRSGTDKGRMKAIRGALTEDMLGFFDKNYMPGIAKGIRRADEYHAERVKQIDEVLQPIIGKDGFKGGEQVVQAVESMARGSQGGNKRLSRLMSNMTGPERGEIRSTLIDRLGRATPGQQTAEGDAFSPATFLTNWNKMTPQAKATLFGDEGLRGNLDDIAKLAEGTKRSQKMANVSNISGAMQGSAMLQIGWAIGHLPSYLAGVGAQYLTGRLMASPKFAKWLAKAPDAATPVAQRKMLDQLGIIAAREPALQQDALALQSHLQDSLARSPGGAAAEDEEGN